MSSLGARRLCSSLRSIRISSSLTTRRLSPRLAPSLVTRPFLTSLPRFASTQPQEGSSETYEFQAETQKLLDIVAKSLYSEKEVFIRELISNASDAIEKYRYLSSSGSSQVSPRGEGGELSIRIDTDKASRTLTISDNGIGMSKEEMISNLGTIARSGSKAFMEELSKTNNPGDSNIIGQFGVGFYSAFMVAHKIDVYSSRDGKGHHWSSEGYGSYSIAEAAETEPGTKIVLHLKPECREFADEGTVKDVIKKYSSFVGSPLFLNGNRSNDLRPLWLMDPKEVEDQSYRDFYNYISNSFDSPRFIQHFRSEAPMDVKALLFVPDSRPGLFDMGRDKESGVALYCRKILIKSRMENIVPQWMRFVKGVVDSEDIPLNLSRELLQDSALIRKLRNIIQNKFLRFMQDRARKDTESYMEFYGDYGQFFKEGIITSHEQKEKEEIAKLLRFETSSSPSGESKSLMDYSKNMKEGQKDIFYLAAPSRQLAESSPYFESLKNRDVEIIFCYESYDELVLMQLGEFAGHKLISVEKEMRSDTQRLKDDEKSPLSHSDQQNLTQWMKDSLGTKCAQVKTTDKLESHPCVITIEEMAAARHFIKTQGANYTEEQRYNILQPQLEINMSHPIILRLNDLKTSNSKLAHLVTEQIFANAMVSAGLVDDTRTILKSMNELLEEALKVHES